MITPYCDLTPYCDFNGGPKGFVVDNYLKQNEDNSQEQEKFKIKTIYYPDFYANPEPLSIKAQKKDRERITNSLTLSFEKIIPNETNCDPHVNDCQQNIKSLDSRLRHVYYQTPEYIIDFFKSQTAEDQEVILSWISILKIVDMLFLKDSLNYFVFKSSHFKTCKFILHSNTTTELKIKSLKMFMLNHPIKKQF